MTSLDLIFGIILLIFTIWGMFKGLLWTLVRILSLAGVILIISTFGEDFRYKLGDMLNVSPAIATVIAYVLIFVVMMIIASFLAVVFRKLLPSIIALSVASLLLSLEFYLLHAPDVAIAEAAIGAGLTMAIFIFAIRGTR